MSWLSSIYYLDTWPERKFVHVAKHTLDDDVYIEISDDDKGPNAALHLTNAEAIEMAKQILAFGLKP